MFFPSYAIQQFGYLPRSEGKISEKPQPTPYHEPIAPARISYKMAGKATTEDSQCAPSEIWFNESVERWERETAIHSAPGPTYLQRDYYLITAKGIENPKVVVPLILNRLANYGGDWFYALEAIAGENPAKNCETFHEALTAWGGWARERGYIE